MSVFRSLADNFREKLQNPALNGYSGLTNYRGQVNPDLLRAAAAINTPVATPPANVVPVTPLPVNTINVSATQAEETVATGGAVISTQVPLPVYQGAQPSGMAPMAYSSAPQTVALGRTSVDPLVAITGVGLIMLLILKR